jgi:cell division protein FtsI (penicillin-binding protein 3)
MTMQAHADLPASQRVRWLARAALLWAAIIAGRLIYLQIFNYEDLRETALDQQTRLEELYASRGAIADRNGHLLAVSVPVETVSINPKHLPKDRVFAMRTLARVLSVDESTLLKRLDDYTSAGKGYMVVAKNVDAESAGRLRQLGLDWVRFEQKGLRKYPEGTLAAHLLGGVNHEHVGNAGVELYYEDEIGGYPGYAWVTKDPKQRSFESLLETPRIAGRNLILTIDRRIQFSADQALKQAVIENRCQSGTAVVMDPHTGEILALSNYPTYDPNVAPASKADYEARKNLAVGDPFEPGSVFKVFTIASALETTDLTPETKIFCHNGAFTTFGRTIHEAKGGYGELSVADVLAKSSNIGAYKIGMRMGESKFHEYLLRFGLNAPTGVELPAESSGLIFRLSRWQPTSLGSVAMGHEVLTTSVQLARALSAIANNGVLVEPRLTLPNPPPGVDLKPVAYQAPSADPRRILRPETAIVMRQLMERVVLVGTGKSARLNGYTSGGKTGTAQMFDKVARRYTHLYNASFMGFAPVVNPNIVVVVTLNGSTKYGGVIAAPVFKEIAESALRVRNVPQDNLDPAMLEIEETPSPVADGAPAPPADSGRELQAALETDSGGDPAIATGPAAPAFVGKTIRAVVEEASAKGVKVELDGSGIAREQDPAPGTRLVAGQRVRVRFER